MKRFTSLSGASSVAHKRLVYRTASLVRLLCALLLLVGVNVSVWGNNQYQWNGTSYTGPTSAPSTLADPTDLMAGNGMLEMGWCIGEVTDPEIVSIGGSFSKTIYKKGSSSYPSGDLYSLYWAGGNTTGWAYSTKPNIYTITYVWIHASDDGLSYTKTTDLVSYVPGSTVNKGHIWISATPDAGYEIDSRSFSFVYTSGGAAFTPNEISQSDGWYYVDGIDGDITITVTARNCTMLDEATILKANTRYDDSGTTRVVLSWTRGSNVADYADKQKLCYWPIGGDATCYTELDRSYHSANFKRSILSNGQYGWSIQALGSGDYCDSEVAEGSFCIDDVDISTPSGVTASSIGTTSATVSWSSMSDAEGYAVTIKNNSTSAVVSGYNEKMVDGTSLSVTGLSEGTTYKVEIYAYNACSDLSLTNNSYTFTTLNEYSIDLLAANSSGTGDGLAGVYTNATALHEITEPTKTGYTIEGYYADAARTQKIADESGNLVASVTVSSTPWTNSSSQWVKGGNATFYTNWTPLPYTISFNANGGSGSMGDVEKDYGSSYALPECSFAAPAGKVFDHWGEGSASGTSRAVGYSHTVSGNITFYAVWRDASFTDYVFSCAELTLTPKLVTAGTPVFITSAASKTVRSQDSILIVGSGLTPSTALTFPGLPAKFEIKSRTGAALATDAFGAIDAVAYIFYTPASEDTSDGLDELAGITVWVEGAKPKTVNLTQSIIGRHLPAEFVIAGKWGKAWYALPANMTETATEGNNPTPVLIAVNDADAPTAAYCASTNAYNLVPIGGKGTERFKADGDKVYLGMVNNGNYALFGSGHAAAGAENTNIGRSSGLTTSVDGLGASYQWNLVQKTADVSTTADVVYNLKIANGNTNSPLKISRGQGKWGLYTSGISEIRLLPLHEIADLDMRVEEWGSNKIAVHLGSTGTIEKVMIDDEEVASPALSSIGGDIYEISGLTRLATSPMSQFVVQMTVGSQLQQKIVQVPFIVTSSDATTIGLRSRSSGGSQEARNEEIKTVDVVVCDGGTLTVNTLEGEGTACTFNNLYIYPGGKVNVNGNTLNVQNIYLRGGFSWLTGRNGESSYKHPQLLVAADKTISGTGSTGHGIFYDLYLTGDQWYLMALPKDVAMSAVRNENGEVPTTSNAWVATYSGRGRTLQPRQQGWTDQEDFASLTFRRGVGYEIAADPVISGRPFSTLRFPLQGAWSAETDCSPTVNSWGITRYNSGTLTANHVGWNLVGNPFYTAYQTSGSGIVAWGLKEHIVNGQWNGAYDWDEDNMSNVKYYTIPNKTDYGYSDSRAASTKLDAFFPFYVQVQLDNEDDGALSFAAATERTLKAPAMYQTSQQEREVIIDFTLSNENSICTSGLNISDAYSADFDMNDKEASITQGVHELKIYTLVGGIRAAFNSLPEASLGTIPLGYKTTTAGTHFISLVETGDLKQIQSATLIDHEAGELEWDLLQGTYAFETTKQASGNDTRFTMRFALKDESVATGIDNSCLFDNLFAIGYDSKIVLHGVPEGADVWVYDMTGKLIGMRRNVTTEYLDVSVPAQGVYNIRVATENGSQTIRTLTK